jgi:hypothetical protein
MLFRYVVILIPPLVKAIAYNRCPSALPTGPLAGMPSVGADVFGGSAAYAVGAKEKSSASERMTEIKPLIKPLL